ncbi:MAG TPA: hypothetical protein VNR42_11510, partial [Solirubrobacteraceae bacterium]|nr:hypothetical protein [Solirubrobacteraceae bacterium]
MLDIDQERAALAVSQRMEQMESQLGDRSASCVSRATQPKLVAQMTASWSDMLPARELCSMTIHSSDEPEDIAPEVSGDIVMPELIVAEYNAARADCLQGLAGQQSILTWSIAAIGVLFAAGLSIDTKVHGAATARPWVFLVGLPILTLGASIAWFGEIFRMERDAHYMRLLEQSTWPSDLRKAYDDNNEMVTDQQVKYRTLMLNTWVARSEPPSRNRVVGYAGGVIIYWGATAGSLAA